MNTLASQLLDWYQEHGRKDLPWQQDRDPYRIWVSEIMLQQTQVGTVIPYYLRFMESFPDVDSLAGADIDEVLHYWSGLGYYARARNLHAAARLIRDRFDGRFPEDFDDVVALPGIGRSTAGAILAFAFDQHHVILDGNVKRVLARYHAVEGWPGKAAVLRRLWELAETHTPNGLAATYNQAIMDLGATLCTRSRPGCDRCPLAKNCQALLSGEQQRFPGRRTPAAKPVRDTRMLIIRDGSRVLLERRPPTGIWGGLWSFPEAGSDDDMADLLQQRFGLEVNPEGAGPAFRHTFTHFHLDITPMLGRLVAAGEQVRATNDVTWYDLEQPPQLGLSAACSRLIDDLAAGERLV